MVRLSIQMGIVLVVAFGTTGALMWRSIERRRPGVTLESVLARAPLLYALLPLALALGIVQLVIGAHPGLVWELPVWLEYHYTAILWGAIAALFAFTFGLACFGAFRTRHPRRIALVIAGVALLGAVEAIQLSYTREIASRLTSRVVDGVVLQTSGVSCVAASAANLARHHGLAATEAEMAALLGTTQVGTSAAQAIHGLARLGITCRRAEVLDRDLARLELPAMLFVDHPASGPESHAVLAIRARPRAEILDPLSGRQLLSDTELARTWRGRALECTGPPVTAVKDQARR
jgi:hypothetical protein